MYAAWSRHMHVGNGPRTSLPAGTVCDILWTIARTEDRLEHIRVQLGPGYLDLVLLHSTKTPDEALRAAQRLCARAYATAPCLSDWKSRSMQIMDIMDPRDPPPH
ncbi:hypothetical protein BF14_005785 [Streptomyces griseus]|nr:hypothetical protein DIJ69_05765 [Streptomyces globisporus]PPA39303.1 hypothetical protein BF14_005785 [Streptomyces griseus]RAN16689.1 hypothetical protein A3838_05655 [Streptomyces badius]RAN24556.1 hypothetical protein A3800_05650 [Streptomyces badius]